VAKWQQSLLIRLPPRQANALPVFLARHPLVLDVERRGSDDTVEVLEVSLHRLHPCLTRQASPRGQRERTSFAASLEPNSSRNVGSRRTRAHATGRCSTRWERSLRHSSTPYSRLPGWTAAAPRVGDGIINLDQGPRLAPFHARIFLATDLTTRQAWRSLAEGVAE
jgi:hypothetical protein